MRVARATRASIVATVLAVATGCGADRGAVDRRPATHRYTVELDSVPMRDGAWIAVTRWVPQPREAGERFPALLELLPYRKDDEFYARDFPLYDWFARRGFLMVKADVRGTGGSTGTLPGREYSEAELDDAVELIAALAADPRSNGRVGMWGISWGGFNAIQVALRHPPTLKAILAVHASDDLFHDDVRYIDGVLHLDRYALQIDHGNALPRTPAYALDSAYFADRFDQRPWILRYLEEQQDGPFWRANALRWRRGDLQVPAYLIGGLLDGYRDTPWRALARQVAAPVKVEVGPWVHAWPDNGRPGPNYEWRVRAARWWDHWLNDRDTGLMDEPPLLVFQRDAAPPDAALAATPGSWRAERWPIDGANTRTFALAPPGRDSMWAALPYQAGTGTAAGEWWGEPTGDMAPDDARAITVDLDAGDAPIAILGMPRVTLVVRHGAALGHWVARLESVAPDGRAALITGGAVNITHRLGPDAPLRAVPGAVDTLAFDLHLTTWTLPPSHTLRLALTTAQFPMLFPSPELRRDEVDLARSRLELPLVPVVSALPAPRLPPPEPRAARRDVEWLTDTSAGPTVTRDSSGRTAVRWMSVSARRHDSLRVETREDYTYEVRDAEPWASRWEAFAMHRFAGIAAFTVETRIVVQGTREHLEVTVTREVLVEGRSVRRREWAERIPRRWH